MDVDDTVTTGSSCPVSARGTGSSGARLTQPSVAYNHPRRAAAIAAAASLLDGAALTANGAALVIYQQPVALTANQVRLLTAVTTVWRSARWSVGSVRVRTNSNLPVDTCHHGT